MVSSIIVNTLAILGLLCLVLPVLYLTWLGYREDRQETSAGEPDEEPA